MNENSAAPEVHRAEPMKVDEVTPQTSTATIQERAPASTSVATSMAQRPSGAVNPQMVGAVVPTRPAIPTRQYLDETVVPILLQALGALSQKRPERPIDFLIEFLIKEKDRFQTTTRNSS